VSKGFRLVSNRTEADDDFFLSLLDLEILSNKEDILFEFVYNWPRYFVLYTM